jgi:tetratricopeptide (TPR) repeat protein
MAGVLGPSVHYSIVLVDVEGFGSRLRTRTDQAAIRHGLYQALELAFTRSGVGWDGCYREDRGDGVLILVPPQVPKSVLAAGVPGELSVAVRAHNQVHDPDARMRLRLALHGGEVLHDAYGVTSTAVNLAFRLLEAGPLKQALAGSPGVLAVITSAWFYEEVIRHTEACAPATWRRAHVTVKETREDGWISLPDAPYPADQDAALPPAPSAAAGLRFSLPPDTAGFTGRGAELDRITAVVAGAAGAGGLVTVGAIDGMPGVGKTALAIRVAHELSARFPDRQLFIDLHAYTPGREPVAPQDALAGLLTADGVDPRFVPGDLDGRAAMWRDRMAGQRVLLVLDNAASSTQVTPLLPGGGDSLVIVTSRRHLGDLPGAAVPVLLDALPAKQAEEMFTRLAPRAAADRAGVAEVVRLGGFLPLAVSLLARVFARHPSWTLADLASETRGSLLTLKAEHTSIAAAFDVSYRHLDPAHQRFFDLLGLHPGTTSDSYAAAALADVSPDEAGALLDRLHGEGLMTETGHRRYRMHDLLRRYARDHAVVDPDGEQALGRLLDYYQRTAALAQDLLARQTRPSPPPSTSALAVTPTLEDAGQALAWARAERDSLLACLDHVTRAGQHARVTALTASLAELLRRDGPWTDAITRHAAAVRAARDLGDQLGQARALNDLGIARRLTGDYRGAVSDFEQVLAISRDLGDRLGQASALSDLGIARRLTGDYLAAAADFEQALAISRDLGDRHGQANALTWLGMARQLTGDYPGATSDLEQALAISGELGDRLGQANALTWLGEVRRGKRDYRGAASDLEQALVIFRDIGDPGGEVTVLNETGTLHRLSGEPAEAEACHQQALELARVIGSAWDEAHALAGLGRCAAPDEPSQAEALLRQAYVIFQRIGAAEAPAVLAELNVLTSPEPGE